jgi:FKBP-type peptidyl-prolyl cis-trans isomerase
MKTRLNIWFALLCIFALVCVSCSETDQNSGELQKIQEYVKLNNITTKPNSSGLYYIETVLGAGTRAKTGDSVTLNYTGKFLSGKVFDTNIGKKPFSFVLGHGQVIEGWDEGIALMSQGGKATLIIPSSLGYGSNDYSIIPGNSTLVFDVELLSVK